MAKSKRVRVSSDGSIDFTVGEATPTSTKKLRQSPEIEGFYRFIGAWMPILSNPSADTFSKRSFFSL